MRQGDVVHFLHTDHLGSTSLTTDQAGGVVAQSRYLPYGQTHWLTGTLTTDFQYTSQRQEMGFGLYDYNARYYDNGLGRFISPDTIVPEPGNPQSFNRYSYAANSPLKFVDRDGHCHGLAGAAFNVCARVVLAVAPAVHQANEYREDIFFPDANTTTMDRIEASTVVGAGATAIAAGVVEAAAGTLTTVATGGVTTVGTTAGTVTTAACRNGDCTNVIRTGTQAAEIVKRATFADKLKAFEHYAKHVKGVIVRQSGQYSLKPSGTDMPEFKSLTEYSNTASSFMSGPPGNGVMQITRQSGDIVRFDPNTGYFGVKTSNDIIRTFFRPEGSRQDQLKYFWDQLGK